MALTYLSRIAHSRFKFNLRHLALGILDNYAGFAFVKKPRFTLNVMRLQAYPTTFINVQYLHHIRAVIWNKKEFIAPRLRYPLHKWRYRELAFIDFRQKVWLICHTILQG